MGKTFRAPEPSKGPRKTNSQPFSWSAEGLTLWHPLLPYGYSHKAFCVPDRLKPSFVNFDIRALWCSKLSVRMSKITNDGLTRSGTGCFIAVPIPYGNCGRQRVNNLPSVSVFPRTPWPVPTLPTKWHAATRTCSVIIVCRTITADANSRRMTSRRAMTSPTGARRRRLFYRKSRSL